MKGFRAALLMLFFGSSSTWAAEEVPSSYYWYHEVQVDKEGPSELEVPFAMLDRARSDLTNLRLLDARGNEVPFLLRQPRPEAEKTQAPHDWTVRIEPQRTVVLVETGVADDLAGFEIETPSRGFVKAITIEGSRDGTLWELLVDSSPVFRHPDGTQNLQVTFPRSSWLFLKVTLDDRKSDEIPVSGIRLLIAQVDSLPSRRLTCEIPEKEELPGETRLTLRFPYRNLHVFSMGIRVEEAIYRRLGELGAFEYREGELTQTVVATGSIHRIQGVDEPTYSTFEVGRQFAGREAVLTLLNGDSPPLTISEININVAPVFLVFVAARTGSYYLALGDPSLRAPHYDLAALREELRTLELTSFAVGELQVNPGYQRAEILPEIPPPSVSFDPRGWKNRRRLLIGEPGIQRLELDPSALSGSEEGLADIRIVQAGMLVPYILDRRGSLRQLFPRRIESSSEPDKRLSVWTLYLGYDGLPLTHITCRTTEPIFRRPVTLYEEVPNRRGRLIRRELGSSIWARSPDQRSTKLSLALARRPRNDTLVLEVADGDNAALQLAEFTFYYRAPCLYFKTSLLSDTWLYYGNSSASAPVYDITLLADEILGADKSESRIESQTVPHEESWPGRASLDGWSRVLFWAGLGLVVIALLLVIARLLPSEGRKPAE